MTNTIYLGNAFSLQMIDTYPTDVHIREVGRGDIPDTAISVVGHPDTAAVLGVPCNRASVKLNQGDTLYVAQLVGGRLPEGSTTLPEGFAFRYLKVTVL